ncbi:polysaccharide lyase family 7 protein [Pseudomonas sp. J452]|uniref:polysaccharide lyase family 7 protein n=1 Tax=Pseudomonas sp. J452 TaxID=2898441 RepID=UPI0021ADA68E|nr:polysaccharide lyase family 7 protein [Pseudomonas sp. J452]UUY06505.1 polysaccharide lyase family 7 protein [Pseudomonas sp. J452]
MIDLSYWDLSIPEGNPVIVIESPQLVAGYNDQYFKPAGGSIQFWAPVSGTSTNLSDYPRTELREAYADGKPRNWLYTEGTATLSARLEVNQLPSVGGVIVGQIHAKDNPYPFLKLSYRLDRGVGYLDVTLRKKPTDSASPVVLTYKSMPLNTAFDYSFKVSPSGRLDVNVAGMQYSTTVNSAWAKKAFYFKTGNYIPDNQGPTTEGGRVTFHDIKVGHQPK